MPLVYRSVFADSGGRISDALLSQFTAWIASKGLALPDGDIPADGVSLRSEGDGVTWVQEGHAVLDTGIRVHRLRLVEDSKGARWITTAAAISGQLTIDPDGGQAARMWVDLEHEPAPGSSPIRPGSPRLVRDLLAAGEAFDGPVPLAADVWDITPPLVGEAIQLIASDQRSMPIVVFAYDGRRLYDQERLTARLARDVAGVATVLRLTSPEATQAFMERLPEGYGVYGGAMRTYLPGALCDPLDEPARHRVLGQSSLAALGGRAFPAVKDQILELSIQRPAPLRRQARSAGRRTATPPSRTPESIAEAARSIAPSWLTQRIDRIAAAVRSLRPDRPSPPVEHRWTQNAESLFDERLDELIAIAREADVTTEQASPLREAEPGLQRRWQAEVENRLLLEQLLVEADAASEADSLRLKLLESQLDDITLEATEAAYELDDLQRRVRWLERQSVSTGFDEVAQTEALPSAPPSVAEVVELAKLHLLAVEVEHLAIDKAAELDLHPGAQLFAIKSWDALQALDAYARARVAGTFQGSFYTWCQSPPVGEPAVSATIVAMGESESVDANPILRNARMFKVPSTVDPTGKTYMPAHIKVVKRGTPAPRLHFHDDVARSGKVYVGYLGAHLPTARFS